MNLRHLVGSAALLLAATLSTDAPHPRLEELRRQALQYE